MITNDARCVREIKSSIFLEKSAFKKNVSFHQQIGLKFKEETSKVLHLEHSFGRAENWTLRKVDKKYFGSFEM
jgi:hypothetical protein